MIKPATLWALFKQCEDSQWLGTICRALGGQNVDLDYGQNQLMNVIKADSGWMDERIEAKREKWRLQKRGQRGQYETTADIADKSAVHPCPRVSAAIRPSVRPSKDNTLTHACAREAELPTMEAVIAWAAQSVNHPDGKAYPTEWAKEWYETMRTATPPWTNVKGESVLPNWKNAMNWAWKRHLKLDKENGKGGGGSLWKAGLPPGMIYQQENYDASKGGI